MSVFRAFTIKRIIDHCPNVHHLLRSKLYCNNGHHVTFDINSGTCHFKRVNVRQKQLFAFSRQSCSRLPERGGYGYSNRLNITVSFLTAFSCKLPFNPVKPHAALIVKQKTMSMNLIYSAAAGTHQTSSRALLHKL